MKLRVTLDDIAQELNISSSTVSRVLNGSSLISEEKSRLILERAEQMGYIPRKVKKHKNRAILNIHLFLPPTQESFIHLFYDVAQLLKGISHGFGDVSINISTSVNDGNTSFLNKKKTGIIDGCIFAFTTIHDTLKEELTKREIPYIHLNRKVETAYIIYDNQRATEQLTNILLDQRGTDIKPCYLGFTPLETVDQERWIGFKQAFSHRDVTLLEKDRIRLDSMDKMEECLDRVISEGYNALMAFNDIIALAFLEHARNRGISIPEEISLTGMDNSPAQLISPTRIDTLEISIFTLGEEAAKCLYLNIMEREDNPCQKVLEQKYIKGNTL
jgi:LacI family transcriptional regulator